MISIPSDIHSHRDALNKAQEAYSQLRSAEKYLKQKLKRHPGDRDLVKALGEVREMQPRLQRQSKQLIEIIRVLSQKEAPPFFKRMVSKVLKAIRGRLVDPDSITVTYGVRDKALKANRMTQGKKRVWTASFKGDGYGGKPYMTLHLTMSGLVLPGDFYNMEDRPVGVQGAIEFLVKRLRGKGLLISDAEDAQRREQRALEIGEALKQRGLSIPGLDVGEDPETQGSIVFYTIDPDALVPEEGFPSRSWDDLDEAREEKMRRLFDKVLRPFKGFIIQYHLSGEEITVLLK